MLKNRVCSLKACNACLYFLTLYSKRNLMSDKKFYIQRYTKSAQGAWESDGTPKSLEDDFGGVIRYKSMTGLNSKGKQKGVYTESYAETDALRVLWTRTPRMKVQHARSLFMCSGITSTLLQACQSRSRQRTWRLHGMSFMLIWKVLWCYGKTITDSARRCFLCRMPASRLPM